MIPLTQHSDSALYLGSVRHRRQRPAVHAFRYPLFMVYLNLAELDSIFKPRWFWSVNRRNLVEFRRSDFLGDPAIGLDQVVRDTVQSKTGSRPDGPICLLAHLRYFGFCFNPVVFYYCFHADGQRLHSIVAEITNTPWKERHAYVLDVQSAQHQGSAMFWRFDKQFHVSPFLPMDRQYHWRFQVPDEAVRVHMTVDQGDATEFDATLSLRRQPLSAWNMAKTLIRYPLMTLQVVFAIHWQAFFIWRKRNPVYDHPDNRKPK